MAQLKLTTTDSASPLAQSSSSISLFCFGPVQVVKAHPFIILLVVILFVWPLHNRYSSPLRHFPGPFVASCTRLWNGGVLPSAYLGRVVRIAPNGVSFSSANAALELFKTGKGYHKTEFYSVFPPPENPDIFTETRESVHSIKKRYAATPYSLASMMQCTPRIEDTERLLMCKLDGFVDGKTICDLGAWLHYFAFDVLGEVAFSQKFGFLEAGVDVDGAIKTIDDSQWYSGIVGQMPWVDYLFRRNPLRQIIPTLSTKNALITQTALAQLDKRINPDRQGEKVKVDEYRDLLNSLIEAQRLHPESLGPGDVFAIAHGAIFAGSDSTASTMQSFCWYVLSDRRVYDKLVQEIQSARLRLSEMVTYSDAQNLPYFQACLKEAMRIAPAVGLNITRKVPPGGAEICGVNLPAGTAVAVNGWVLHRDKSVFGDDAHLFRPERWLEGDADRIKVMERCMFQFGGGSHVCIGRHLALLEMNKVLPQVFRRYDLKLVNPGKPLDRHSSFFVVQSGLLVYLKLREKA